MFPIRYIHAADLHLDAAFKGVRSQVGQAGSLPASLEQCLTAATFTALDNLVALCERERPDFLLLAGDIYNEEDQSLKAQLALRDACVRLQKISLPVYIVHGNHDPLSSRLKMIAWPENTHIFGAEMEHHLLQCPGNLGNFDRAEAEGQVLAVIHGISHNSTREGRNLAKSFSRLGGEQEHVFQVGLLHCAVESVPHAERYAPCTLKDLEQSGLDAWALGHVHERRVLSIKPFVAYAGNTQGLHINEQGPRGCYLITATPKIMGSGQNSFAISEEFHALAPVLWEKIDLALDGVEQVTQVEERIQETLEAVAASASVQDKAIMVRINLTGHTVLDGDLRYKDFCQQLCQRFQHEGHEAEVVQNLGQTLVWLKDIVVDTQPVLAMDELRKRDDLLGETLRLGQHLQQDSKDGQDFVLSTLAPLYGHVRAKAVLQAPQEQEITALLEDAARLCADLMESK